MLIEVDVDTDVILDVLVFGLEAPEMELDSGPYPNPVKGASKLRKVVTFTTYCWIWINIYFTVISSFINLLVSISMNITYFCDSIRIFWGYQPRHVYSRLAYGHSLQI